MNAHDLIEFEQSIADLFNKGMIRHPIHLSDGNEDQLIEIFKDIGKDDWIAGSWRSHLHCLLKGVPPDELKAAILRGESISLCFPEYRVVASAIVGGIIPIAMGIALGIKRSGGANKVHCFLGDMTSCGGAFHESRLYARNHKLPIKWIVENNGMSVMTETAVAWGAAMKWSGDDVLVYRYKSSYPHAGAGERVEF